MRVTTQLVREETFSFTPNTGEPEIHIRSGQLREWLLRHARDRVIDLTFPDTDTLDGLVARHGLEEPRLRSMTVLEAGEPVIVGMCADGTSILIDGGHRRWFWAKRGVHTIKGWALPEEVWRAFSFDPTSPMVINHHADGSLLPQRRGR
jgi:hypothetical protein